MGDQKPREIPPRHAHDLPPAKKPTGDVRGDAIQAIDKELTEDLTYMAGARRKSVGPTNHLAGAPAPGNKSLNASKSQKKRAQWQEPEFQILALLSHQELEESPQQATYMNL